MKSSYLRIPAGILLIAEVFLPLSVGLVNFFTLLPGFLGAALLLAPAFGRLVKRIFGRRAKMVIIVCIAVLALVAAALLAELCVLLANSAAQTPPKEAVVIVLGAQVIGRQPSMILSGRIAAAADYLKKNPQAVCIASGGRGSDELVSEAQCIKEKLISGYGISPGRIYEDDGSFNTVQNFANSRAIIQKEHLSPNIAVVTDGFHMFRAKMLAARQGLRPFSCPAATDGRLVVTFYLRELLALPKSFFFDR